MPGIDSASIARRAYEIWEREGRPSGQDQRHWFEAERALAADPDPLAGASDPMPGTVPTRGAPETRQQSEPMRRGR